MKCRELDRLLCDYVDDALDHEQRRAAEDHLLSCASCSQALAEAEFAVAFLHEAPSVEPPPQLIADIIHETIGIGGALAPAGGGAVESDGFFSFLRPLFQPVLQPRFVMSMAMSVLSLSMMTFYGKRAVQNWQGQASPTAIVESVQSGVKGAWDRVEEIYDSAAMFYELQTGYSVVSEPEEESGEESAAELPNQEEGR